VQYKKLVKAKPNVANYQYKFGGATGMKALVVNKFAALALIGDVKKAFFKSITIRY
jgi:hypothetical protein